ncbi:group II intron maturase-specific domain-containing protein [Streptomyces mirabilis]
MHRLNRVLRGWTAYFRFGVSHATFRYLRHFVWQRVIKWLRRKFRRSTWKELRRRYCGGRWWPVTDEVRLFDPARVKTVRYLYRGMKILLRGPAPAEKHRPTGACGTPVARERARRVRRAARGNGLVARPAPRLGPTLLLWVK